jgi:hypothetical protein
VPRATESLSVATHKDRLGGAMGVSVWENHEDLELVGRAACQIPISGFPKLDSWAHTATGALASDFVVLVLSEAVLSETVLVLDGCLKCGDADC